MYKKIRLFLSLTHQCLFYSAVILTAGSFLPGDTTFQLLRFFLLIPVLVSAVFTPRLHEVWQLMLLHLLFLFLPPLWCRSFEALFLCEAFIILLFFIHFLEARSYERKRALSDPSVFGLILILLLLGLNEALQNSSLQTPLLIIGGVEILIYSLDQFLQNMSDFVDLHQTTAEMPLKQMERVDHGMILIFLSILGIFFLLIPLTHLDRILRILPDTILWILRILLSLFTFGLAGDLKEELSSSPVSPIHTESTEPSAFLLILGKIFAALILTAAAVLAVIALYRLLSSRLNRREDNTDQKEFLMPFEQKQDLRHQKKKDALSWRDFSPSGQVRRIYIKTILKAKKKKQTLSASHTPSELEQSVQLPDNPDTGLLHRLYEKARYSQNGCSKEDWDHFHRSGM